MGRTRTLPPKERVNLVRQTQKNGWSYVLEVVTVYDPRIKNSRKIRSRLVGKLPPGETDKSKMIPTDKKYSRSQPETKAKNSAPVDGLKDTRLAERVIYPLDLSLFVFILAMASGHQSDYQIAEFWKTNHLLLSHWFPNFPKSDISHDTVRRLIMILGKENSEQLIRKFTEPLLGSLKHRVIAVDGQAVRASTAPGTKLHQSPYVLNIYDTDNGLCLQQKVIDEKHNEITYASELIRSLDDISGAIVTCDALNTQKAFLKAVLEKKADYCVALKANHGKLHEEIEFWFSGTPCQEAKTTETVELGHGRLETRTVRVLPASTVVLKKQADLWPGLQDGCVIEARTHRENPKTGEVTSDVRYFISSLNFDERYITKVVSRAIRNHWGIENSLHWTLDVTFNQDRMQCCNGEYLAGRTLMNKVIFNIISKLQANEEKETGKKASTKPVWKTRLSNLDTAIRCLAEIYPLGK